MLKQGIEIIADANSNSDNPEYERGQIELLMNLVGYSDDGHALRLYIESEVCDAKLYWGSPRSGSDS